MPQKLGTKRKRKEKARGCMDENVRMECLDFQARRDEVKNENKQGTSMPTSEDV